MGGESGTGKKINQLWRPGSCRTLSTKLGQSSKRCIMVWGLTWHSGHKSVCVCVVFVLFTYLVMVGDRSKVLLDVGYSLQPWELGLESVCRVPYWVAFHCCPRLSKRILIVKKKDNKKFK